MEGVGTGSSLPGGLHDVERGGDDLTVGVLNWYAALFDGWDEAGDLNPVRPGQVGRASLAFFHARILGHGFRSDAFLSRAGALASENVRSAEPAAAAFGKKLTAI